MCGNPSPEPQRGEQEVMNVTTLPVVRFDLKIAPDHVALNYTVSNTTSTAILLFDRLYDMKAKSLDPDWAYVEVDRSSVAITRAVETLPPGLLMENPPVPYAREVPAGAEAQGTIRIALPIEEVGPYYHITRKGNSRDVSITKLDVRLGWSPKPADGAPATGGSWVDLEGERLLLLPYWTAIKAQRIARSEPRTVNLKGKVVR